MTEAQETIQEVKSITKTYLEELCTENTTPYLCKLRDTKKGYKEIEQFVINMVFKKQYTIADALFLKERQLNPQMIND